MQTIENAIQIKEDGEIVRQSNELVEKCEALVIKTEIDFARAVDLEKFCKAYLQGPATIHDEIIDGLHKLHTLACGKRNALKDGVERAWKSLKDRRATWQHEQEMKRQEEQRKAEAEARAKEAEKQAKIQQKIDEENKKIREAQEEEARKQREKDAEIAKIKNKARAEEMQREEVRRRAHEESRMLEEKNRAEEKKFTLEEKKAAVYVAPRIVAPAIINAQGTSIQFDYEPVVTNLNIIPRNYFILDVPMLKRMQKAAKGTLVVPGVEFTKIPIGRTGSLAPR